MKKNLIYFLSAFMFMFAAGCSEMEDVSPVAEQNSLKESSEANAKKATNVLQSMKVSGVLADGSTFAGRATITSFTYDAAKGGLLANGEIQGTVTSAQGKKTEVRNTFSGVQANLLESGAAAGGVSATAECQILFLELGPIFLDVLGLQVDLSQIVLDITAVSGSGNLLGNLLCAVAGLLDGGGLLDQLIGNLEDLLGLLNQINNLLG